MPSDLSPWMNDMLGDPVAERQVQAVLAKLTATIFQECESFLDLVVLLSMDIRNRYGHFCPGTWPIDAAAIEILMICTVSAAKFQHLDWALDCWST